MIGIGLDAIVLMVVLKIFSDDDLGFGMALVVALIAAIGTTVLAVALGAFLGVAGGLLGVVIAAALLSVAISAMFGIEIKRSFLVAGIFMVAHLGFGFAVQSMLAGGGS